MKSNILILHRKMFIISLIFNQVDILYETNMKVIKYKYYFLIVTL